MVLIMSVTRFLHTRKEMQEKLEDCFSSGVIEVWYVYPTHREVHVFSGLDQVTVLGSTQTLEGRTVLPGFTISLGHLFEMPNAP